MASIKGILKNLDWQLKWLHELAPVEFGQAVSPLLGADTTKSEIPEKVLWVLLYYLDHDDTERFIQGVGQIVKSMEAACQDRIVNQVLHSLSNALRAEDETHFPDSMERLGYDNSYLESARAMFDFFDQWQPGVTKFPDGTPMSEADLANARHAYDYGWVKDDHAEELYGSCDSDGHPDGEGGDEDYAWEWSKRMAALLPRCIPDASERRVLIHRLSPFGGPDRRNQVALFNVGGLRTLLDSATNYREHQTTQRYNKMVEQLATSGPYRDFGFRERAVSALIDLGAELPNFEGVIGHLAEAINLSIAMGTPLNLTPLLLVGKPGIGKSHLVRRLGEILGVNHHQLEADNLHHASALAGAEPIWSTAAPGLVFEALTSSEHVSPIISLDEIDKAALGSVHGDPLAPLHSLLEPETASHFRDSFVPLAIDASHVIWIATANSLDRLSESLLSRFVVFSIKAPTPSQSRYITDSIVRELMDQYPGVGIAEEVIEQLTSFTPRVQRRLLGALIARVTFYGSEYVVIDDLNDVLERLGTGQSMRSGFGFAS